MRHIKLYPDRKEQDDSISTSASGQVDTDHHLPRESKPRMDRARRTLLAVCCLIIAIVVFDVGKTLHAYRRDDNLYRDLRAATGDALRDSGTPSSFSEIDASSAPPDSSPGPAAPSASSREPGTVTELVPVSGEAVRDDSAEPVSPFSVLAGDPWQLDAAGRLSRYAELWARNANMAGWLRIPGFRKEISYPVMQAADNEWYLTHDFYENKSQAGSIFLDSDNRRDLPGRHMILYGHAMKDMSMFGQLKDYPRKPEDNTERRTVLLDLMAARLEYEVFSAYYTVAGDNYRQTGFKDDAAFLAYLRQLSEKSAHDYGVVLSPEDRILTLSTCDDSVFKDGRSVLHARLVRMTIFDGSQGTDVFSPQEKEKKPVVISANVYLDKLALYHPAGNTSQGGIGIIPENARPAQSGQAEDAMPPASWLEALLSPPFQAQGKNYTAVLPDIDQVWLQATLSDPKALMLVKLNGAAVKPWSRLSLPAGPNTLTILVTSQDHLYMRLYTLIIQRVGNQEAPPPVVP